MKRLLQLLLLALLVTPAWGQNYCNNPIPPCDPNDPRSACYTPPEPPPECEPAPCNKCTKSPCYASSGVYTTRSSDLSIRGGFPIDVARLYQSNHGIDGAAGYGWISGLSARLYDTVYLKAAPSTYQKEAVIRMPDGALYRFNDNGNGTFTPPEGRFDTLVRNNDGTFTMTLQRSRAVHQFDANGRLVSRADDFGNTQTWTYSGDRLQRITDTMSGRYVDVTWGADGRISDVTDLTGRSVHYTYNTQGMLTGVTNPLNQTTTYSYVTGKWSPVLSGITDHWNRNITTITWDAQTRVKSYTEKGETWTYTYGYKNHPNVTAKTDSVGNVWQFVYNSDGLVTQTVPPGFAPMFATGGRLAVDATAMGMPGTLASLYRGNGTLDQKKDQVGVLTGSTQTTQGSRATVTYDEDGTSPVRYEYGYDANFPHLLASIQPVSVTTGQPHPHWQGVRYDYYAPGSITPGALHRIYRVDSDGVTTHVIQTYTWDAQGRVSSSADEGGALSNFTYDAQGNLSTATEPAINDAGARPVTTYAYDALGRVTSMTDALGKVTTYTWDALDRMKTKTLPKPSSSSTLTFVTTWHYDEFDAATQLLFARMVDANGRAARVGKDAYGQLIRHVGFGGDLVRYEYTRGLATSAWDANNNRTTYAYDALRRLTTVTYPDATYVAYTYNHDGTVATQRDRAGQVVTLTYDPFKRITGRAYPGGGSVTYTYQGQKLTQVVDTTTSPAETHTFTWDNSFRVTANTQAGRGTLNYTYDTAGRVATRGATGGATTTVGYYPNGSIRTLTWSPVAGNFKFDYTLTGNLQALTFPNNQTREYTFDDQGRLTDLSNQHPSTGDLAVFAYGHDIDPVTGQPTLLGHRTSVSTTMPAFSLTNAVSNFSYDARYLLSNAVYPAAAPFNSLTASWTYDGEGNRLTQTVNGTTSTSTYFKHASNPLNGWRLQSDGTSSYAYDANGNVTSRGADTFTYDWHHRLRTIAGSVTASYAYDYNGRRSAKTVAGTSTEYLYANVHAIAETTGGVKTEYLFAAGHDHALAMVRGGTVHYFDVDALGSIVAVNDTAGTVQNAYLWDAWGNSIAQTATIASSLGYTAREAGEAGLQFYRARFYEPSTARFTGEDSEHYTGRLNPYLYVLNNPLLYRDPSGRDVEVCYYSEGGGGFGHVGFRTGTSGGKKEPTWGFYPEGVQPDMRPERECKWVPTTPEQDDCMTMCRNDTRANPPTYWLTGQNCTNFVRNCFRVCGLPLPDYDGPRPEPFFDGL